jgi:rubrerythrin
VSPLLEILAEGRGREEAQARFYRRLTSQAEATGDGVTAERLNELLADEQHHVSRLTARILELGGRPGASDPASFPPGSVDLADWEETAREREKAEVAWYEEALDRVDDAPTRTVLEEILDSERHHLTELGGKWMSASPPGSSAAEAETDEGGV